MISPNSPQQNGSVGEQHDDRVDGDHVKDLEGVGGPEASASSSDD